MGSSFGFPTNGVPDQGWKISVASVALIVSASLFVAARIGTRVKARQLGADDYAILASLFFSVIISVSLQLAVSHGYGSHKADLTKPALHASLRWFYIEQIFYKLVICCNKVSVVLMSKRIFISQSFQVQTWIVLSVISAWTVASLAATIWQCEPIMAAWDSSVKVKCIDTSMFWMAYAVTNILTDAVVIALPIPQVLGLNLNRRQKLLLCGVFMLGCFVSFCSIMRIVAVIHDDKGKDTTWDFVPRNIWSLVETNVGIITACLPVLRTLAQRTLSSILGSDSSDSGFRSNKFRSGSRSVSRATPQHGVYVVKSYELELAQERSVTGGGYGNEVECEGYEAYERKNKKHVWAREWECGRDDDARASDEVRIVNCPRHLSHACHQGFNGLDFELGKSDAVTVEEHERNSSDND